MLINVVQSHSFYFYHFFLKNLFICLAAWSLSCGTQDLSLWCSGSSLQLTVFSSCGVRALERQGSVLSLTRD